MKLKNNFTWFLFLILVELECGIISWGALSSVYTGRPLQKQSEGKSSLASVTWHS